MTPLPPFDRARRIAMCARLMDWSGVAGHVEQCKALGQTVRVYTTAASPDERAVMVSVSDPLSSGAAEIATRDVAAVGSLVARMQFYGAEVQ